VPGQFSPQQLQIARQLFSAPQIRQAGPKVRLALAETPLVESGLSPQLRENSEGAAGPLQQTPRQGWGTLAQVTNPRHAAESFLKRAIPLAGRYATAGQLAQAVQRSAYPERYDQHKGEALQLLKALGGDLGAGTPEGGRTVGPGQLSVSTAVSGGSTQALQEVLAQVKALSGPSVLAAQAQPARPAFSAGPTLPEGSKAPAPIQQKSPASSLLPVLERALSAAQAPNVESKVQPLPRHMSAAEVATGSSGYVNPLPGFTKGRTDQGVDYSAKPGTPIRAIGNAKVLGIEPNWFQGQPYVYYRLTDGPQAGRIVYVAEQITPQVKVGQTVRAGQRIGVYAPSGTGIETGFGTSSGATQARVTSGYTEGQETPAGVQARRFLASLGAR
jgi:murein DD-endopeptidase MepM/ murein hydrolase activator NlpD